MREPASSSLLAGSEARQVVPVHPWTARLAPILGTNKARGSEDWMYAEFRSDQATQDYEAYHAALAHFGKRLLFFFYHFAYFSL